MIEGGVGSIRLRPRSIDVGEVWFMSASSTPVAHEGFPVALPTELYSGCVEELKEQGGVGCTLTGTLRFVDDPMRPLFGPRIPQLYLLVEELQRSVEVSPGPVSVSAPVAFQSPDGAVHAAYGNFRPGQPGSLERAVEWLEDTYVKHLFEGRVVTDFDEQVRRFGGADFSLEKVMDGRLDVQDAVAFAQRARLDERTTTVIVQRVEHLAVERIDTVTQDRVINIGAGATVNAPVTIADSIEGSFNVIKASSADDALKQLLEELTAAVAEAAHSASPEQAAEMARDIETLAAEATSAAPRRKWCQLSIDGLREAAHALGEIGTPILDVTTKLVALLP
jgi:hypothetical protein